MDDHILVTQKTYRRDKFLSLSLSLDNERERNSITRAKQLLFSENNQFINIIDPFLEFGKTYFSHKIVAIKTDTT